MVSYDFLFKYRRFENLYLLATAALVLYSQYFVFLVVPNERVMGAVQRIFYFHVGAAISCYLMIGVLFVGSVAYLALKNRFWDQVAEAGGAVSLLLCTIVLLSGMIWGHSAWNTWWRWEPRLVSFLVLWLILVSYNLLRLNMKNEDNLANVAAILGIVAALNIPIVIFSIRLLTPAEQLHPEVLANQGLKDWRFTVGFRLGVFSFLFMSFYLLLLGIRQSVLSHRIMNLSYSR